MELISFIIRERYILWLIGLNILTGLSEIATLITVVLFIELILKGELRFDFLNDAITSIGLNGIAIVGALLILSALLNGGLRFFLIFLNARVSERVGTRFSKIIMKRQLEMPYKNFITLSSSDVSNISFAKVNFLVDNFIFPIFNFIATSFISLCIVISISLMEPVVTIIMCLLILLLYISYFKLAARKLKEISRRIPMHMDKAVSISNDLHLRFRDLVLQNRIGSQLEHFVSAVAVYRKSVAQYAVIATFPRYIFDTIGITIIALVAIYYVQFKNDDAVFVVLGTLLVSIQRLLPIAQQLFHSYVSIKSSSKVASEIADVLRIDKKLNNMAIDINNDAIENDGPSNKVSNLRLSFKDDDGNSVFIGAGEILHIIGESGSGKSHFVLELLGLITNKQRKFHFCSGSKALDTSEIYGSIEYLGQLVFLPQETINNYLGLVELDLPERAIKYSNLEDFFSNNEVLETRITEYGKNFSEGQKQRLAYLKAILSAPALLVLDEAFSNLDNKSREIMIPNIKRCFPHTVVVYISHFDDKIDADKKLIVENRKVRLQQTEG